MAVPVLKMYRVTSPGTTYNNVLSRFGEAGGPAGTLIGPGAATEEQTQDFGDVQAGQWSAPQLMIWTFDANGSVSQLKYRLYDAVSNLENFFPGSDDYDFRIRLGKDYVDPSTYTPGNFITWGVLPNGTSTAGYDFDANIPDPGNDSTSNMIIAHNSFASTWVLNCWVYIVFKNVSDSIAGEHIDWSFRTNMVYS